MNDRAVVRENAPRSGGTGLVTGGLPTPVPCSSLGRAVLRALAYGDLFGCPLTLAEAHRYLVAEESSPAKVAEALDRLIGDGTVRTEGGLFALASGETGFARRLAGRAATNRAFERACRWGRRIARLPFVRMVALTGALAAENPAGDDFDYLIVTVPGRLWLCRALVIQLVVRPARLAGDRICPNYFVTADRLAFAERNPFTAREVAQMIPLGGFPLYDRLRAENDWVARFLPNAEGAPASTPAPAAEGAGRLSRDVERLLGGGWADGLEDFERTRKIAELERRHGAGHAEVDLSPHCCKGHFDAHGERILSEWHRRLARLGLAFDEDPSAPEVGT